MELVLTSSSGKTLRKMKIRATNFDEITSSPEALAEFLTEIGTVHPCEYMDCNQCKYEKQCSEENYPTFSDIWLAWLKQENKE